MEKLPVFDVTGSGILRKRKFVEDFLRHGQLGCVITAMKATLGGEKSLDFISTLLLMFCKRFRWLYENRVLAQRAEDCWQAANNVWAAPAGFTGLDPMQLLSEASLKYSSMLASLCGCTECKMIGDHLKKSSPHSRMTKLVPHVDEAAVYSVASSLHTAVTLHSRWGDLEFTPMHFVTPISMFHILPEDSRREAQRLVTLIYLSWVKVLVSHYFLDWAKIIKDMLVSGLQCHPNIRGVSLGAELTPASLCEKLNSVRCRFEHDIVECQLPRSFDLTSDDFGVVSHDTYKTDEVVSPVTVTEDMSEMSVSHSSEGVSEMTKRGGEELGAYFWDDLIPSEMSTTEDKHMSDVIKGVTEFAFHVELSDSEESEHGYLDLPEFEKELYKPLDLTVHELTDNGDDENDDDQGSFVTAQEGSVDLESLYTRKKI